MEISNDLFLPMLNLTVLIFPMWNHTALNFPMWSLTVLNFPMWSLTVLNFPMCCLSFFSIQHEFPVVSRRQSCVPLSQVKANCMELPPAPQKASKITSQRHRSAMCSAIFSGVTENQPSEMERFLSSIQHRIPSSNLEKRRYRCPQYLRSSGSPAISGGIRTPPLHFFLPFLFDACRCEHVILHSFSVFIPLSGTSPSPDSSPMPKGGATLCYGLQWQWVHLLTSLTTSDSPKSLSSPSAFLSVGILNSVELATLVELLGVKLESFQRWTSDFESVLSAFISIFGLIERTTMAAPMACSPATLMAIKLQKCEHGAERQVMKAVQHGCTASEVFEELHGPTNPKLFATKYEAATSLGPVFYPRQNTTRTDTFTNHTLTTINSHQPCITLFQFSRTCPHYVAPSPSSIYPCTCLNLIHSWHPDIYKFLSQFSPNVPLTQLSLSCACFNLSDS
ncbi:hypothetical protein MAR_037742, partial [Mya arenaria]